MGDKGENWTKIRLEEKENCENKYTPSLCCGSTTEKGTEIA